VGYAIQPQYSSSSSSHRRGVERSSILRGQARTMCIKNEAYQEVIAIPINDNGTEWSDDQPVLHLDVKTMMTQEEEEEDEISCFAKAELLEHLKISGPLRVLITDLTAKRLGGGGDPFDLSTEVSTAFPSSSSLSSVVLLDERERCPNDNYDAIDGATPMDPSSSSFDNEDPWQKKKRRRRRRRVRMVAGAVGCGLMGGVFLGPAGLVAGAASGAFVLRTTSKIGERRKDARTAQAGISSPRRRC
jgi:hypothetical protein